MIDRQWMVDEIVQQFRVHRVCAILGARQIGKTTLARRFAQTLKSMATFFDLESEPDARRLENPELALADQRGFVIIDEIQRRPQLFETIRVLVDRPGCRTRFLVLGSASPTLVKGATESLAGRMGFVDMGGFSLAETDNAWQRLWVRGGFPGAFLARSDSHSMMWRQAFIRTFLERDIPRLGITVPAETLRRFWSMVAHYHGQIWNGSEFGRALGTSEPTARRYLDILAGAYMVRVLPPWFENVGKRQVKSPKIYIRDSGLLHALFGLGHRNAVLGHAKAGASWEGFALEQIATALRPDECYHWNTHNGAELDLLAMKNGTRVGFELKLNEAPTTTRSMHIALDTLGLEHLYVVHPGVHEYELTPRITALPITAIGTRFAARGTRRRRPSH